MSALTAQNWALIAFVIGVTFLCVFMLTVPQLLGGRTKGRAKHEPFESGVVSAGGARMRLSVKFYLVAIFFVIFDLEALFLYTWSVAVREVGWQGFIAATIFIVILIVGLIYELRTGALNWSPHDLAKANAQRRKKLQVAGAGLDLAEITRFNGIDELERDPTGKVPAQLSGRVHSKAQLSKSSQPSEQE
ncbi:MAG: NADH-quinone oxidoreductase subunit A [Pseudomonadota bacterium]|nr:NADH-quinone oxidoreductase subunit A [Pseudomonadota bacterium]